MDLSILLVQYRPDEGELRRTLASLLRQSCRDFELVVADDGSDEDFFPLTRKILAENGFTGRFWPPGLLRRPERRTDPAPRRRAV